MNATCTEVIEEHCGSCRYWQQYGTFAAVGVCRRRPPVVISEAHTVWPRVGGEDWCGEWVMKGTLPPEENSL